MNYPNLVEEIHNKFPNFTIEEIITLLKIINNNDTSSYNYIYSSPAIDSFFDTTITCGINK